MGLEIVQILMLEFNRVSGGFGDSRNNVILTEGSCRKSYGDFYSLLDKLNFNIVRNESFTWRLEKLL